MEFNFTGICKLTLDHHKGDSSSKHVKTDFLLEVSDGLDKSKYIDSNGLPTKDGCHVLSRLFTSGLAAVIHHSHIKGYRNDVEHIKDATNELTKQFATSATTSEGTIDLKVIPKDNFSKEHPFSIHTNSVTSFSFSDRIRILFGKKFCLDSTVFVDTECEIARPTRSIGYVERFYVLKRSGGGEVTNMK